MSETDRGFYTESYVSQLRERIEHLERQKSEYQAKLKAAEADRDHLKSLADRMGSGWALVEYAELEAKVKTLAEGVLQVDVLRNHPCWGIAQEVMK